MKRVVLLGVVLAMLGVGPASASVNLGRSRQITKPLVTISLARREVLIQQPEAHISQCVRPARSHVLCRVLVPVVVPAELIEDELGVIEGVGEQTAEVPYYADVWPRLIHWRPAD